MHSSLTRTSTQEARLPSRWLPWPKRVDLSLLCFFGLLLATCDRVNMAVAAPFIIRDYGWSLARMGWVLSLFYIGYVACMIPAGFLADRWGPKRVFAFGVGWWSLFTMLTPFPRSSWNMGLVRALIGTGESVTVPSISATLARWFPPAEYARAAALSWSGGYAGSVVAFPLASMLLNYLGWRQIFYFFGFLGAIWLVFWFLSASDRPEKCRGIAQSELDHILSSRPSVCEAPVVPWGRILREPASWAVFALHFSSNWFIYFLMSWLPTYLQVARHFSLRNMAIGSSLPFISALCATNFFGALLDRLCRTRNRTRVSKMFMASFVTAIGILLLLPYVSSPPLIVGLLSLSTALLAGATPVYASGALHLVPRFAGSFVGVQNSIANLAGIVAPVLTGYLAASHGWSAAFACTAIASALGISTYLLIGKVERVIE
jgi:MFS family permease